MGPHADYVEFFVAGRNAALYGSQGQQRSIVLAFKLAEAALIQEILGQKPVLLLDDVMSELDAGRRNALVSFIEGDIQTFITTANLAYFDEGPARPRPRGGAAAERGGGGGRAMRKLKADLDRLKALLEEKNPGGAEALRFAEVNDLWKNAVAAVFGGDSAALVLDHTNSVYVMSGEQGGNLRRFDRPRSETQGPVEGKVLAVYCDDSMVRSELDNRQELLKMKFKEQGEDVEALRILPSTAT